MKTRAWSRCVALLVLLILGGWAPSAQAAAPVVASIVGEIESITINDPNDPWSGGFIAVNGGVVILPRNLLIDLPANRLTLKQIFDQAPAACVAAGETGLAKSDSCNTSGTGGLATIAANKTSAGNTIAGDVFIQKGLGSVAGVVTYINHTDGYLRVNGVVGNATAGTMVRINDPTGRHTVQQGLGCLPGSPNCSPDPRFTLDPDNYTNVFTTGYPLCIPSTVPRTFVDVLGLGVTTAQSAPDGTGDVLCPATNRSINLGQPVDDSRRFAPIQVGDSITADGNLEAINFVSFLSSHTLMVSKALTTKSGLADPLTNQPDYIFFEEVFIDAPGFQNQRTRSLFIGFSTLAPADVLIWSLHRDPVTNQAHEFPLATTTGCDTAAGLSQCTGQGIIAGGGDIFRIRYDVDFGAGAKPSLNPCAHLIADPRMWPLGTNTICPASPRTPTGGFDLNITEMFGILSPIPHEIQGRTGKKIANPGLTTLDVRGNQATNGQYLFPFGIGLGGIDIPNFFEIDINRVQTPYSFSGIPWNLDRRLSPGGCLLTGCDALPQPLAPFPFEGLDPRLQAPPALPLFLGLPTGTYNDTNFTQSALSGSVPQALGATGASNRILSYVSGTSFSGRFNFDGNNTVLAWPPVDPPFIPVPAVPPVGNAKPVNDFDGDGKTDLVVWRPADGNWYIVGSQTGAVTVQQWGAASDKPVHGDYDGDGKADIAVWRPAEGNWYIRNSSTLPAPVTVQQWGVATDIPVPGDYDGDGKTDIAVWRPSEGNWYIQNSSSLPAPVTVQQWGTAGDVPVPGDYDGDGKTDIAVWRPSEGNWYIRSSLTGTVTVRQWGVSTDVPVVGDFDGDRKADVTVWRPAEGTWYILGSQTGVRVQPFGVSGDLPVPGDYDGDGQTDIANWRNTDGTWYLLGLGVPGSTTQRQWGTAGDVPMP